MKAAINNQLVAKLKSEAKPYDIRDTRLTGFIIRVNPTGRSNYVCQYSRGKRMNIGSVGILTPMQARERATQILGDAAKGIDPCAKKKYTLLTFAEFVDKEYAPWRITHRKNGPGDIHRLKKNFMALLGSKPLREISPLTVERWRSKRIQSGIKPATVNRDINNLKACLSTAKEWGIINSNPLASIKPAKVDNSQKVRYLSKHELNRLMDALHKREIRIKATTKNTSDSYADHLMPMVLISLNTGLRRGELFSLQWENINLKAATITIVGEYTKSGKTRHIPLNKTALEIVNRWKQQSLDERLVFPSVNGNKFTTTKKAWKKLLDDAQIENFRWHDMRHHFASWLVMGGIDLNTVRELLGHASIQMTLRYAHLAPEHKAKAVAILPHMD